jgi:hypothetical protein
MGNFKFSVKEILTVLRERWREPAICIPVVIVILGFVFFTANQALNIVDKVSAMWESPKPSGSVLPLAQPKLAKMKKSFLQWRGKTWVHSIVLKVNSPIQAGPAYVEVRAPGIKSMAVSGDDKQMFLLSDERNKPGIRRIRIQNPSVTVRVRTVTERGTKVSFDYGFE